MEFALGAAWWGDRVERQGSVITQERAARRYLQIREIDKAIQLCDASIHEKQGAINELKDEMSTLQATKRSLQGDLRVAARDQGDLPLVDLMEELAGEALEKAARH